MSKKIYKSAIDNIKFSENLNEKILNYLAYHSSLSQKEIASKKVKNIKVYTAFAATMCALALAICIPLFKSNSDIRLPNSTGNVSAKYINKAPTINTKENLSWLTEEELFHKNNTDIFMGKIQDIKNIKINFNGSTTYRAIAKIKISKVYRGNETVGETVSLLIPCSIGTNELVEDTEGISSMKVGMTGIFMPVKYDKTSCFEENGAKIYWKDISEYGLRDGMRYAFLNTQKGLIFERHAYESIASATSLEEVEQYVIKMIK